MPSKRDVERRIGDIEPSDAAGIEIVFTDALVLPRSQAEDEGREILGLAETATDEEYVRVPMPGREHGRTIQLGSGANR